MSLSAKLTKRIANKTVGELTLDEHLDIIRARRDACRRDLFYLATEVLGYTDIDREVHGPVIAHLPSFEDIQGEDIVSRNLFKYTPLSPDPANVIEGRNRRILLDPRGWFKCLKTKDLLSHADGSYKNVLETNVGDELRCINDNSLKPITCYVTGKESQGLQECFKVRFRSGREVEVSHNHPFRTILGWVKAEDLVKKDRIASLGLTPEPKNAKDIPWAEICGWFLGDGYFKGQNVSNINEHFKDYIVVAAERAGGSGTKKDKRVNIQGLRPIWRSLGVINTKSHDKFVPGEIFTASNRSVRELLFALYMSDGTCVKEGIYLTTKSKQLAGDVQRLLRRFDIWSVVRKVYPKYKGEKLTFYKVCVTSAPQVERFRKAIGWEKEWRFVSTDKTNPNFNTVPKEWRQLYPKYLFARGEKPEFLKRGGCFKSLSKYDIQKTTLAKYADALNDDFLRTLARDDIYWDSVEEVVPIGKHETWAIETTSGNFGLDDLVTHNSTLNVIAHSVQLILNFPDISIHVVHAQTSIAEEWVEKIKNHFIWNEKMRYLFPEFCFDTDATKKTRRDRFTSPARVNINISAPTVSCSSIASTTAGMHFHWMKFSDIVEFQNTRTPEQMQKVVDTYYQYENLLISPRHFIDIEGTCYHFGDLYNRIIEQEIEKPPEKQRYQIFVRGCFVKETITNETEQFTPEERDYPDKLDEDGNRIVRFAKRFPLEYYEQMEAEDPLTFACTPGWQKILMADWTEKPIKDVGVGDVVWGWAPHNSRYKATPAKVKATGSKIQKVYELTLSDGERVYCTDDHKWWTRKFGTENKFEYKSVSEGSSLISFILPKRILTEEQQKAANWLGGIFDGEGTCGSSNIAIVQNEKHNPEVCQRIRESLEILHYPNSESWQRKAVGTKVWYIKGGKGWYYRFIEECNPAKRRQLLDKIERNGLGRLSVEEKEVVSVKEFSEEPVFWLETATGNYISGRKLSKNCQQLNSPAAARKEDIPFPLDKMSWISAEGLKHVNFQRYEMTVDTAEKITQRSDFTAIVVCGIDRAGRVYMVDAVQGKFLPERTVDFMFHMYFKWKCVRCKIEESSFNRGLFPTIKRQMDLTGKWISFDWLKRDTNEAKRERVLAIQPWFHNGSLRFSDSLSPYIKIQLRQQFSQFPMGRHDDLIDALADQFQGRTDFGALKPRASVQEIMEKARRNMLEGRFLEDQIYGQQERSWQGLGGL